ncbi:MAG: DNA polymerase domain-containing protein [Candidatus Aenigmatarchaeota archaeon]
MEEQLFVIDADYTLDEENKGIIRIYCKDPKGKTVLVLDSNFFHYFYALPINSNLEKLKKKIESLDEKKLETKILSVETVERNWQNKNVKLLKITISNPRRLKDVRDAIKDWKEVEDTFEYDIPFTKRYLIDKQLEPMGWIEVDGEETENKEYAVDKVIKAKSVKPIESEKTINLKVLAFDSEFVEEDGEPKLIMLSLVTNEGKKKVITSHEWREKPSYVEVVGNEVGIIKRFISIIREEDPDFLVGYNCLPHDEEIILENGEKMPIGKYTEKYQSHGSKPKIMGLVNNTICPVKVLKTWKYDNPGYHKIIRFKTRSGREIKVTPGNKLLIGTEKGMEWKFAKDVRKGDLIATPKIIKVKSNIPDFIDLVRDSRYITDRKFVRWLKKLIRKKFKTYRNAAKKLNMNFNTLKSCKNFQLKKVKETILPLLGYNWRDIKGKIREIDRTRIPKIDEKLMYIGGLVAADGSIDKGSRNELYLGNTDKKLIKEFKKIIEQKFGKKVREVIIHRNNPKQKDMIHAQVSCSLLKDFLTGIGISCGNKDKNGIELSKIFSFNEKLIGAFIAGLIDGDGYIHGRTTQKQKSFYIACKNKKTKIQIKKLLTRLGIIVSLHSTGPYFIISRDNIKRIKQFILPFMKKKQKIEDFLKRCDTTDKRGNLDVLPPFVGKILQKIRERYKIKTSDFKSAPHSTIYYYEHNLSTIHRDKIKEIAEELRKRFRVKTDELDKVIHSEIFWDKIVEIREENVPVVYDLTTSSGNFVASDIIVHNSDGFDIPKIKERAEKARLSLNLGRDTTPVHIVRRGRISSARTKGRVHIDLFNFVSHILAPSLRSEVLTLDEVAQELLGIGKKEMKYKEMVEIWSKKQQLEKLTEYSLHDSELTLKLAEYLLPQIFALSRITGQLPFDVSRYTYSQLVEAFLMRKAFLDKVLIPNRPKTEEIEKRRMEPTYKGAIVIEPKKGIHSDILMFDFKSLYPTVIVTHNIDPWTFNYSPCKNKILVPEQKYYFCADEKGFIPKHLAELIERRKKIKEKMKKLKRDSKEYKLLDNEQFALKTISNATYGYFAFVGSKWYKRECGEAAASFGRFYIKKVIELAKKENFEIIYGDTDSLMLRYPEKLSPSELREIGKKFEEKVNKQLPGIIEIEFRNLYEGGIFVTREKGEVGAKKRYALIDYDGNIEIRGYEAIRRDWCELAKKIQREVLTIILKEKNPAKAIQLVRDTIKKLKEGKVDLEDLIIYEQITRPLSKYEQIGPHVKAAMKLLEKGFPIGEGTVIQFLITKGSGSISDRAFPIELVKKEQYDPDYYINHQILPASLRVLKALGYKEQDILQGETQKGLVKFIKK